MQTGDFAGFRADLSSVGVATITLNRPAQLNALTRAAKRDLIETLLQAQMDDAVRVIVFTGEGRAFCAGDDLNRARQHDDAPKLVRQLPFNEPSPIHTYEALLSASQMLTRTMLSIDKITIAAVNGVAVQSGLSLALACDLRIAAASAQFTSGTLRYGFLPDEGGHWLLTRAIGTSQTVDFILNARTVDASTARTMGLVQDVVPDDQLHTAALEMAERLANGPQVALRLAKRAILHAGSSSLDAALEDIATKAAISDHHADVVEGRRAFAEHRAPQFNVWLGQE